MHALNRPPKDATVPSSFSPRGVVLAAMVAAPVSIVIVVPVRTIREKDQPN